MLRKLYIVWAYVVELLAAGLLLLMLCLWFGPKLVASFIRDIAIDVATLFGSVMLAASLGFLWTLYSKVDTQFYRWLDTHGAFRVYLLATAYSVVTSFLSTMNLVALKKITNDAFALIGTFLLLLAMINLVTLVRNVIDLMLLNSKFNRMRSDNK